MQNIRSTLHPYWLDKISWKTHTPHLNFVSPLGEKTLPLTSEAFGNTYRLPHVGSYVSIGAEVDLRHLEESEAHKFLEPDGLAALNSCSHQVWSTTICRYTWPDGEPAYFKVTIPASCLIAALLPISDFLPAVFRGHSPYELCNPPAEWPRKGDLRFGPHRVTPGSAASLAIAWVTRFPTAMRMWRSVTQSASQGHIALQLPVAKGYMRLAGYSDGKSILVDTVNVRQLWALEPPSAYAATNADQREWRIQSSKMGLFRRYATVPNSTEIKNYGFAPGAQLKLK